MLEEKKTVKLKDEELEKVGGGNDAAGSQVVGKCGITTTINACAQYNDAQGQCIKCQGAPGRRVVQIPLIPGDGSQNLEIGSRRGGGNLG